MVNCIGGEQLAMEVEEWMEVSVSWWWAKGIQEGWSGREGGGRQEMVEERQRFGITCNLFKQTYKKSKRIKI
jgi:hypothetical protein